YNAATGRDLSVTELQDAAMRMLNIEKVFNYIHAGFERKDDYPPSRDMEEAVPSEPLKGFKLEKEKWDALLDEYYNMHGWDKETGLPKRCTLEKMGLEHIADDLDRYKSSSRNY
ncbi:MAG: aldehyde ferredoxin oxidoreductase C-terminal domain-containing protein, partial [Bacillota bacterium]|nr:aldehyde ferredoxin oxidoreductase C-terminal domain-containing protein [Bacillota bacterium]